MKKLNKLQQDAYMAIVSQRGNVLNAHHGRFNCVKVGVAILTVMDDMCGVKHHVVGFNTEGPSALNALMWSNQHENVIMLPNAIGPTLDLTSGVAEGIAAFNKENTANVFCEQVCILTDVLVF